MFPDRLMPKVRTVALVTAGMTLFLIACQSSVAPPTGSSYAEGVDPVADSALSRPSLPDALSEFLADILGLAARGGCPFLVPGGGSGGESQFNAGVA